jgi:hypothetical protein
VWLNRGTHLGGRNAKGLLDCTFLGWCGVAGMTISSGAPVNGVVIDAAADSLLQVDSVHCKKYPH